jgi:anti-sigma B factor antagonist
MNIRIKDGPADKTVAVNGMVTLDNCHLLMETGTKLVSDGFVDVVMDFSQVDFIDSAGIGTLVSLSKLMKDSGGCLRLTRLNENLRRVLSLSRLDKFFAIDTPPQAEGAA